MKRAICTAKNWIIQPKRMAFDRQLERVNDWSADQLAEYNWQQRKQVVAHCAATVPFYQKRFAEIGFEPGDLKRPEDWERLPALEKQDVRDNQTALKSTLYAGRKLAPAHTGGTTGKPLRIWVDPNLSLSPISWRNLRWWGVDAWMNCAYAYRVVPTGWRKRISDVALYPSKRAYLTAMQLTPDRMAAFCERARRIDIKYLVGYVGALDTLARFVREKGIVFPSLRAVWAMSAPLPEMLRSEFEAAFGCPAYDPYGSGEFYFIAGECSHKSGLHVCSDVRHVDIDQPNDTGHGDILVTDLLNRAFPLLRYRIGDRGRHLKHPCPCGRPFPLIDYIHGRTVDVITLDDDSTVPGEFWSTIFSNQADRVRSFQVHQHADRRIVIRFEPHQPDPAEHARIIEGVRLVLAPLLQGRATVEFAAETLDVHDNGKTRLVVSDYKPAS